MNSVIGMVKDEPPVRDSCGDPVGKVRGRNGAGDVVRGLAVETDDASGLATRVAAVRLGPRLEEAVPQFWLACKAIFRCDLLSSRVYRHGA